jgi:hypothetical protein
LTTTWQQFYVYGTAPASTTQIGVRFRFTPVGTAGGNDFFELTGVQLEANSQPTQFEHLPIGFELGLCQRYYFMAKSEGSASVLATGFAQDGQVIYGTVEFPTQMRITPTSMIASATTGSYTGLAAASGLFRNCLAIAYNSQTNKNKATIVFVGTGGNTTFSSGQVTRIAASNNQYLAWEVEL